MTKKHCDDWVSFSTETDIGVLFNVICTGGGGGIIIIIIIIIVIVISVIIVIVIIITTFSRDLA